MTLKSRLEEDMKQSMRARARLRLQTIRTLRAAILNAEIEQRGELDDPGVTQVLARELKLLEESLESFRAAGRDEQVADLEQEIALIREYLPPPLSHDELVSLAREAIAGIGAQGPQDIGRVMGRLMPEIRGRADGSQANAVVRRLLTDGG